MPKERKTAIEKATYVDIIGDVLNQPEIPICRDEAPYGRVYYEYQEEFKDRIFFPSPTTILNCLEKGIGFQKWLCSHTWDSSREYANKRAWIGTMTHMMCTYILWGREVNTAHGFYNENTNQIEPVPYEVKKRLQAFLDFLDVTKPIPLGSEVMLYTHDTHITEDKKSIYKYPFAGTLDHLYYIDDKLMLCDLKTGAEHAKQHELQCTAYKMLFDYIYGEKYGTIDAICCLYLKDNGKYKLVEYKYNPDAWIHVFEIWKYLHTNKLGNLPKVKEKLELPDKYIWKQESEETNGK